MNNRPYLKNSNLADLQEIESRKSNAIYIINCIKKSKSNWFICEMIRNLYFYIDFDFVKEELRNIYIKTSSEDIKSNIRDLHDGKLDVTDLIEQAKINSEFFEESKKLQKQFEAEFKDEQEEIPELNPQNIMIRRYNAMN